MSITQVEINKLVNGEISEVIQDDFEVENTELQDNPEYRHLMDLENELGIYA